MNARGPTRPKPALLLWLGYRVIATLFHQPELLRTLGTAARRLQLKGPQPLAVRYETVRAVFVRHTSFSNRAHATNMPADRDFVIGLDSCPAVTRDRQLLEAVLGEPKACADACDAKAEERVAALANDDRFDLVGDYLAPVVWAAFERVLGAGAAAIVSNGQQPDGARCPMRTLFAELQTVGGHLIVGDSAPPPIERHAHEQAAFLNARVDASVDALKQSVSSFATESDAAVRRNTVGIMWVGHPGTTQAGALLMRTLLKRPDVYRALREEAASLGDKVWSDEPFRARVREHVLEGLRFFPPFPILTRTVPRDTAFDDDRRVVSVKAGARVVMSVLNAMFDPAAVKYPERYWPGRPDSAWSDPENRWLMFGAGPRRCIARKHVVEILASALIGLVTMPALRYPMRLGWIRYDGPIIVGMRLAKVRSGPAA